MECSVTIQPIDGQIAFRTKTTFEGFVTIWTVTRRHTRTPSSSLPTIPPYRRRTASMLLAAALTYRCEDQRFREYHHRCHPYVYAVQYDCHPHPHPHHFGHADCRSSFSSNC